MPCKHLSTSPCHSYCRPLCLTMLYVLSFTWGSTCCKRCCPQITAAIFSSPPENCIWLKLVVGTMCERIAVAVFWIIQGWGRVVHMSLRLIIVLFFVLFMVEIDHWLIVAFVVVIKQGLKCEYHTHTHTHSAAATLTKRHRHMWLEVGSRCVYLCTHVCASCWFVHPLLKNLGMCYVISYNLTYNVRK